MRTIITEDIFKCATLIHTGGLKETFEALVKEGYEVTKNTATDENAATDADVKRFGIHAFVTIVDACGKAGVSDAFYDFISGPFEMTSAEVKALPIDILIANFKEFSEKNNLKGFFELVGKSM